MFISNLSMRNFMPFMGEHALDIPLDKSRNVVLVFGDNMKGKTSLLNAIRWAFYGKANDRYGVAIPLQRLVNQDAAADGDWSIEVAVRFEHEEESFELVRSATPLKGIATPQRTDDFRIQTQMTRSGVVLRGDQIDHTINQIVPEQISRFFLFDGELLQEYESLLRDDGDQGRRIKEAIEDALGVPALAHGKDELRALKKPFERQQALDLKKYSNLTHFTNQMQGLQRDLEILEADKSSYSAQLVDTKRAYQELSRQVEASEGRYAQKTQLDFQLAERKRLESNEVALDEQRKEIAKDAWKDLLKPQLEAKRLLLQRSIDDATKQHDRMSHDRHVVSLRRLAVETLECPVCLQSVSSEAVRKISGNAAMTSEQNLAFQEELNKIGHANSVLRRLADFRFVAAKQRIAEINTTGRRQAVELTRVTNSIEALKKELEGFDSDEMGRVRRQAEQTHHVIRVLEQKLEDVSKLVEKNLVTSESLRHVINQDKDARGQKSSKIVDLVASLEGIFSKAIARLRDDLKTTVEARATSAFKAMTTDQSYERLKINDNYGLTIVDHAGRDVTLRSAGAEQIVALSLIDGLNQTGRSAGPVFMDTPFGRLDPKHRANVLRHLPESAAQVVLLVHEGELRREFDLGPVAARISAVYSIEGISSSQSKLVRDRL
jgi:DNA sulfur modification protein DndD